MLLYDTKKKKDTKLQAGDVLMYIPTQNCILVNRKDSLLRWGWAGPSKRQTSLRNFREFQDDVMLLADLVGMSVRTSQEAGFCKAVFSRTKKKTPA